MDRKPAHYRFDDIRVDLAAHRIEKAGVERPLEPKAFAVLVQLLARQGELVGRDELLDAVWAHRHVTPSALNRIIVNLRKSLGDDTAQPRYIETVHGLGYRFIGASPARTGAEQASASDDAPAGVRSPHASPGAAASAGTVAPHRRHAATAIALAVLALLASAAAIWQARSRGTPDAAVVARPVALGVLPFYARGDDAELAAAAEGLSESLTDAFTRVPTLSVAGRDSVFALGRGRASAQRVAAALDLDYVLGGEVVPGADGTAAIELRVTLWRRGDAAPVWVDSASLPREQLFRAVVRLIAHVQATLVPRAAPVAASAATIPAQDLYWLGRRHGHQRTPESLARALGYFQRAVAEDPDFALGYTGIADASMLLYEYGDMTAAEAIGKARSAVARAKELAPELADVHASEGLILIDEDRPAEAAEALANALRREPQLPNAMLWYGNALAYEGRVRDARTWHAQLAAQDPLNPMVHTYLGVDAMLMGDEAAATASFRRAIELNADYAEPYRQLALQHQFHGRLAEAVAVYREARKRQGADGWTSLFVAYVHLLAGDADAAMAALDAAAGVSAIERAQALVWARLLQRRAIAARQEVAGLAPGGLDGQRRTALLARIDLLEGRDAEARAGYDAIFAAHPDRGDVFLRVWLPDLSLGHYAAWIALLPDDSPRRKAAIAVYEAQLDRYAAGGLDLPILTYQRALLAALSGDAAEAGRLLAAALDQGWLDASALERDPAWRRYATAPWLAAARTRIGERIAVARTAVERESAY